MRVLQKPATAASLTEGFARRRDERSSVVLLEVRCDSLGCVYRIQPMSVVTGCNVRKRRILCFPVRDPHLIYSILGFALF